MAPECGTSSAHHCGLEKVCVCVCVCDVYVYICKSFLKDCRISHFGCIQTWIFEVCFIRENMAWDRVLERKRYALHLSLIILLISLIQRNFHPRDRSSCFALYFLADLLNRNFTGEYQSYTYPPFSIAWYSFTQLSELKKCRAEEPAQQQYHCAFKAKSIGVYLLILLER